MTLAELREKRNAELRTAAALVQKAEVTAEDRSNFDAIMAAVDGMESDITRLERIEKFESEQRAIPAIPRANPGAQNETVEDRAKARKEAFRNWVMRDVLSAEKRDLTTANTSMVIPQEFYPILLEAKKAWGGVANLVTTKRSDNGAPLKIALVNDTTNGLQMPGEQGATLAEADPAFTTVTMQVDEVSTGLIKISWAEMEDSYWDLDGLVRNFFGKRYARGLAQNITNGNASNVASLKSGATVGYTTAAGSAGAVGYSDLASLYAALDPAYEQNASWSFNSTTRAYLMEIKDTLGRPIFIPNPSSGAFDVLFGRPVVLNQYLDNAGVVSKVPVQYGDFSQGYILREVGDLKIVRLNERYADELSTGFIGYTRIGGINTNAGVPAVLSLATAAS